MKKNLSILAAFLMTATLLVSFASCDDGSETNKPPKVTSVKIGDANGDPLIGPIEGVIGTTIQFRAIVEVSNGAPKTVNWEVESDQDEGLVAGTGISNDGLLTINADESEGTILTVTATSTRDAGKSASIRVTLVKAGPFTITYDTDEHGSIEGPETALADDEVILTIYPDNGYELNQITAATSTGDDVPLDGSGDTRTFTMPAANVTVFASFKEIGADTTYMVNVVGNDDLQGTVTASPNGGVEGTLITLTVAPATDYELDAISAKKTGDIPVDLTPDGDNYTFTMPDANVTVTVSWKEISIPPTADTFTVNITGNNSQGTVTASPNGGEEGTPITLTIEPATGYELDAISATSDGNPFTLNGSGNTRTFTMPAANVTVTVSWKEISAPPPPPPDTVSTPTATPGAGQVASGSTVALATATPDADIWYTTDDSTPAKDGASSTLYSTPITITAAVTIKAIAVKDDMTDSAVLTAAYTISSSTAASPIIDAFDYYETQATQAEVNAYGFTVTGGNWWYGLILDHFGLPAMQMGGDNGPQSVTRTNANYNYATDDLKPLVATYPTVSLMLYSRGAPSVTGGVDTFTFELRTGNQGAVEWTAPSFDIVRALTGPGSDYDSGWVEMKIPLTDFVSAGDPITSLAEMVITGWKITAPAGVNHWISDIKLIQETVASGYKPQGELYTISKAANLQNGDFTITPSRTIVGATVTLRPLPELGYALDTWDITPPDTVTPVQEGSVWTFPMPAVNITVGATFVSSAIPSSPVIDDLSAPFADYFTEGGGWEVWYAGFDETTGGRKSIQLSRPNGPRTIGRTNQNTVFVNDITGLVGANTKVSVGIHVDNWENPWPLTITFGLDTGTHPSAFTTWSADVQILAEEDQTFVDFQIPVADLLNAGVSITTLDEIVVTGWRVTCAATGGMHLRVSAINLVDYEE